MTETIRIKVEVLERVYRYLDGIDEILLRMIRCDEVWSEITYIREDIRAIRQILKENCL